jgi:hypothetical protein
MGVIAGANINDNGLIFSLDAANFRSYSGSGLTSNPLVGGVGATLVNGTGFSSANGGSFFFDGTNDYIDTNQYPSTISLASSEFSVCLWVKVADYSLWNSFISRTTSNLPTPLDIYTVINDGKIRVFLGNVNGQSFLLSNTPIPLEWTYVSFTLDSNFIRIYLNGIQDNFSNTIGLPSRVDSSSSIWLGTRADNFTRMKGNISQVKIYNRALTAQEIKQNYNATKKRYGL